jgi:putative hemolysin
MSDDPFQTGHSWLDGLLGLNACREVYRRAQRLSVGPFEAGVLQTLDIQTTCDPADLSAIPRTGPLVVAANHPHGALDGLVLAALLRRIRPDVRLLANHLLSRIPELGNLCFFVDPFEGPSSVARSQAGLRAAHLWLKRGGALVVFPAGEVAHRWGRSGTCVDSPWRPTVGRLVTATGATVVPAFIEGTNSRAFYAAGRFHATLRTALLARELLRKRGSSVRVRFNHTLSPLEVTAHGGSPEEVTATIRAAVDSPNLAPLINAMPTAQIELEIDALPGDAHLVDEGAFQVFCVPAAAIPLTLTEIGRLREVTYRASGEGTGRAIDLDAFDERYLHLFTWDRRKRALVGAYRIGRTDRIVATHGVAGLYSRTLFHYDERLLNRISPALELGRSFVRPEYQRSYGALLSLWKGIGRFVVMNPQYRVLLGTVSISPRYSDTSQQLLMEFLSQNRIDAELAELATAITPPRRVARPPTASTPRTMDEVNRLVAGCEADGKSAPVLLRQYLKLNAKLIGFNVDTDFADALDALMMVDLTTVEPGILQRYLGREGTASFLARHRERSTTVAA